MVDAVALITAARLGYTMKTDEDGLVWYHKDSKMCGPYATLEEAAYDALADHEINEAYKFWRGKDATDAAKGHS